MKKYISCIIAAALLLSAASCGAETPAETEASYTDDRFLYEITGEAGKEKGLFEDIAEAVFDGIGGIKNSAEFEASAAAETAPAMTTAALGTFPAFDDSYDEGAEAAAADAAGSFGGEPVRDLCYPDDYITDDGCFIIEEPCPPVERITPKAGLLTGGEWSDKDNFDFWTELISGRDEWREIAENWRFWTGDRITAHVNISGADGNFQNIKVKLYAGDTLLWETVTDNRGNAYLFPTLDKNSQYIPTHITAEIGGQEKARVELTAGTRECDIKIDEAPEQSKTLDLMLLIDTTGSMSDELSYLQAELEDIIERVTREKQVNTRLSVNFYRDTEDEYIVRGTAFTDNITDAINEMNKQRANGGGDYPEAVEQALNCAINERGWSADSTKLMFLVLDAPPHYNSEVVEKLRTLIAQAAAKGIRIIPVASSGVDTDTEFLCRSFATATGGTYTFLTDHSGIGGSHLEPTIGFYQVEMLNDMLVRIIESYL